MGRTVEQHACPWCGSRAVEATCIGERKNFICVNQHQNCGRRYFDGDGPELPPTQEIETDEINDYVEHIATRAAEIALARNQQPEKPTLFKRLFSR
jgi:hypothetical protein